MAPMTKIKWVVSFTATVLAVVSGTTLLVPQGKIVAQDGAPEMHHDARSSETAAEIEVEIAIRKGRQARLKGHQTHGQIIELLTCQHAFRWLRNGDIIPLELASPLFFGVQLRFLVG